MIAIIEFLLNSYISCIFQMCRNKVSIAIIGHGPYARDEIGPLFIRDGRVSIRAVFAFNLSDANSFANSLKLGDDCG